MNKYEKSRTQKFSPDLISLYRLINNLEFFIPVDGYVFIKRLEDSQLEVKVQSEFCGVDENYWDQVWKLPQRSDLCIDEYDSLVRFWLIIKLRYYLNNYKRFTS